MRYSEKREMSEEYLNWLGNLVDAGDINGQSYWHLLELLQGINFRYFIANDSNRASDGYALRIIFSDWVKPKSAREIMRGPCTVLEMLIALARRCEDDIMHEDRFGDRTPVWFWEMIGNLHLEMFTDEYFYRHGADVEQEVYDKIDIFLDRLGHFNGEGGIFPRKSVTKDQRKIEFWMQMCGYFSEKYFENGQN